MASADFSPYREKTSSKMRIARLAFLALAGAFMLFLGTTGIRIVHAAGETARQKADAIIVFGAAEYSGRPSPVYKARLDHGLTLYRRAWLQW